jgi:hypothetical protein
VAAAVRKATKIRYRRLPRPAPFVRALTKASRAQYPADKLCDKIRRRIAFDTRNIRIGFKNFASILRLRMLVIPVTGC